MARLTRRTKQLMGMNSSGVKRVTRQNVIDKLQVLANHLGGVRTHIDDMYKISHAFLRESGEENISQLLGSNAQEFHELWRETAPMLESIYNDFVSDTPKLKIEQLIKILEQSEDV